MARDYKREYKLYQGTPEQKQRRASRGRARYQMEQKGLVRKGDGKDVDHKNFDPMNNNPRNLRVVPASANRSFQRLPNRKPKK